MLSYATSSPSAGQTRFCWMRTPSLSCSWWNRTVFLLTALKSFTGTLTRPKLMAPVHMERGIRCPPRLDSCPNYPHPVIFIADDREIAAAPRCKSLLLMGTTRLGHGTKAASLGKRQEEGAEMIGILIAVLFAALVWAICVALGLPAIVGIVAAILVLLAGVPTGGY